MVYFYVTSLCSLVALLGTATAAPTDKSTLQARSIGQIGSNNWSGALVSSPGKTYKSVSATMIVPQVTFPQSYSKDNEYISAAWVGFSGYTYLIPGQKASSKSTALLQVGFQYIFDKEGDYGVYPFYKFIPAETQFFDNLGIDVKTTFGDKIRMTVSAASTTAGTILFENLTTGKSSTKSVTAPAGTFLDLSIVEWISEDFTAAKLVKTDFSVDYGTMTFSDMTATFSDGSVDGLTNAFKLESDHGVTGGRFAAVSINPAAKSASLTFLGPNGKRSG